MRWLFLQITIGFGFKWWLQLKLKPEVIIRVRRNKAKLRLIPRLSTPLFFSAVGGTREKKPKLFCPRLWLFKSVIAPIIVCFNFIWVHWLQAIVDQQVLSIFLPHFTWGEKINNLKEVLQQFSVILYVLIIFKWKSALLGEGPLIKDTLLEIELLT